MNTSDNITLGGPSGIFEGPLHVPSLVALIVFYIVILAVGIGASLKSKTWKRGEADLEDTMLAGRNIGVVLGIFTMTATWVGGGYINGTAEAVFKEGKGLAWTLAPFAYSFSISLNGLVFAKKFRERGYVTMLDPIQVRYGRVTAAVLYIPAVIGDIFWSSSILSALGGTLRIIVGLSHGWSVVTSAVIAVVYTIFGGLYSVALTDVLQLSFMFVGLWLAVGFALVHPAVSSIAETAYSVMTPGGQLKHGWLGVFPTDAYLGLWLDQLLTMILGGIPWQVYYQRVCSQKTALRAQVLSFVATAGCLILAAPAILLGAVAKSADWNATDYPGPTPLPYEHASLALPLVIQYLTPLPVAVIGLGAISAAVMSSCDSSVLSASSMFARNVYASLRHGLFNRGYCPFAPSEREILWVMRVGILFVGFISCFIAYTVNSVYGLFVICSEFVYILFFPALLCSIYIPRVNHVGVLAGFAVGSFMRLTGGDQILYFPALIKYPYYNSDAGYNLFPFKTMAMLSNLIVSIAVSEIVSYCRGQSTTKEQVNYMEGELFIKKTNAKAESDPGNTSM